MYTHITCYNNAQISKQGTSSNKCILECNDMDDGDTKVMIRRQKKEMSDHSSRSSSPESTDPPSSPSLAQHSPSQNAEMTQQITSIPTFQATLSIDSETMVAKMAQKIKSKQHVHCKLATFSIFPSHETSKLPK